MPDANGKIKGVSIPCVPWHQGTPEPEHAGKAVAKVCAACTNTLECIAYGCAMGRS